MTKEEFYEQMPLIIDTKYTSYPEGMMNANNQTWEFIYQAFKSRLKSECTLNIWPDQEGK